MTALKRYLNEINLIYGRVMARFQNLVHRFLKRTMVRYETEIDKLTLTIFSEPIYLVSKPYELK